MDKREAENIPHTIVVHLPRFASKTDIREGSKDPSDDQFLATVHLWRLGLNYNVKRWMKPSSEMYVVKKTTNSSPRDSFSVSGS
ncbi:hypothetical protein CLCR_09354 [Cladophialophora carrionii]|uniref:Uncharacterized protein n=1 Tax=Cladophialophora carrionii TaxID=86049 RepID=A0A1C1CUI7_9EURO|nr:hypothetical protein CLCR_09354 [Cladophialophora carrionii]